MDTKERRCLECNAVIRGRTDKKFCSDYCRNSFNNKKNRATDQLIRKVNHKLRNNYRVLKQLELIDGKVIVPKKWLLQFGFDFDLFTSMYRTKKVMSISLSMTMDTWSSKIIM